MQEVWGDTLQLDETKQALYRKSMLDKGALRNVGNVIVKVE